MEARMHAEGGSPCGHPHWPFVWPACAFGCRCRCWLGAQWQCDGIIVAADTGPVWVWCRCVAAAGTPALLPPAWSVCMQGSRTGSICQWQLQHGSMQYMGVSCGNAPCACTRVWALQRSKRARGRSMPCSALHSVRNNLQRRKCCTWLPMRLCAQRWQQSTHPSRTAARHALVRNKRNATRMCESTPSHAALHSFCQGRAIGRHALVANCKWEAAHEHCPLSSTPDTCACCHRKRCHLHMRMRS